MVSSSVRWTVVDVDTTVLRPLVEPFAGDVFCHAPADRPFELDALARPDDGHDRWSSPGTSTIYLAGDPLVALAEFARHADAAASNERRIFRLRLGPTPVLDLRRPDVVDAVGFDPDRCGADRDEARSLASALREAEMCGGLVVPSMAFRDDPSRYNVVVFAEAIARLPDVLSGPSEVGRVAVSR